MKLPLQNAEVILIKQWLAYNESDALFGQLLSEIPWHQGRVRVFGKWHDTPRLQSWHGDSGISYTYSGKALKPQPWTPALDNLKQRLKLIDVEPNSVLCNLYRDGKDRMGWHRDDEPELGQRPVIASVSLGAARDFRFRHIQSGETESVLLEHGSLLIMRGDTQHYWEHCLPARLREKDPRINLTFRVVKVN